MDQKRNADVIVPVLIADLAILGRLRKILDLSGPALGRLLLVDDGRIEAGLAETLADLAATEPRLRRFHCSGDVGWVELCNRGLSERTGDAVVLLAEVDVTEGWLSGLAEAVHSEERAALAAPVDVAVDGRAADEADFRRAVEGLPRWTATPRAGRGCNYLRGDVLDAVPLLDPTFKTPSAALDDWLMRARSLGFFAKRANHVFVFCGEDTEPGSESVDGPADREVLQARHPQFASQVERFDGTLDASLARHAIEFQGAGKLRVAYDLRHLPMEQNGTKMYAISLGKALAEIPEIDLTLLVAHPIQADGVPGRIVSPDDWADDVAVIHKPAQIFDRRHAKLLFESKAHVIITYQDLIAYRMPGVFATEGEYSAYRNTSCLTLPAAQGILAYSQCTAREIADEFAIPIGEVAPIFLGVDVDSFATPVADEDAVKSRLNLPSRYFLSLASDYPHKNIAGLLEAYALFRDEWSEGEPPALILAGNAPRAAARILGLSGVSCLGVVSADELKALYQNAEALVFPSLYEGFGLPPLEAMAAGAAVVAMPFSSVPEVCGDAAHYCDGLTPVALARAMRRLAIDDDLRAELIAKGRRRIETLQWRTTALATYEVYRNAVLRPSSRSIEMRRFLSEAIVRWSEPPAPVVIESEAPPASDVIEEAAPPVTDDLESEVPPEKDVLEEVAPPETKDLESEVPPAPDAHEEVVRPASEVIEEVASHASELLDPDVLPAREEIEHEHEEEASAIDLHVEEPASGCVVCEVVIEIVEAEPIGVINACCALRAALGRRVRRDLAHLKDAQRSRLSRARRLSRRFIEVAATDGLGAASWKAVRKLTAKTHHVVRAGSRRSF